MQLALAAEAAPPGERSPAAGGGGRRGSRLASSGAGSPPPNFNPGFNPPLRAGLGGGSRARALAAALARAGRRGSVGGGLLARVSTVCMTSHYRRYDVALLCCAGVALLCCGVRTLVLLARVSAACPRGCSSLQDRLLCHCHCSSVCCSLLLL